MRARSLMLWIRGRSAAGEGSEIFTARRGTLATPIAFAVAAVFEITAVHLLVPWAWLQWTLLLVSLWGMLTFFGILAHHRVHPHTLDAETLTLRTNGAVVAVVPRESIVRVHGHRRYAVVSTLLDDGRLFLPTSEGTSVDIELSKAVRVHIPAPVNKWQVEGLANSIALQVDEPTVLVRALAIDQRA